MGTLYVSTLPAGGLEDWPVRAQRRLAQVSLVVAESPSAAQEALRGVPLAAPLVGLVGVEAALEALDTGDVMVLLDGAGAAPPGPAVGLARSAVARGHAVEAVPGPALPVTALVVSGLPADGFAYLGRLPAPPAAREELLASVAAERRTLVLSTAGPEPGLWEALYGALGARPAVLYAGEAAACGLLWRGNLGPAGGAPEFPPAGGALVIGGAVDRPARWAEDRVAAEIGVCLGQGMGPGQAAKHLAGPSGWPRRTIYRMAAEGRSPHQEESNHDEL